MSAKYPRFETQVFPESPKMAGLFDGLPLVRRALFETGIPKAMLGGGYRADSVLTVTAREEGAPVVRFGTSGLSQSIGVDAASGNVIGIVEAPEMLWNTTILVNTTVELFTETVRALIDRSPYYRKGAGWDEIDQVSDELRGIIRAIDPATAIPGCYWPAFVDDVQMGDLPERAEVVGAGELPASVPEDALAGRFPQAQPAEPWPSVSRA